MCKKAQEMLANCCDLMDWNTKICFMYIQQAVAISSLKIVKYGSHDASEMLPPKVGPCAVKKFTCCLYLKKVHGHIKG